MREWVKWAMASNQGGLGMDAMEFRRLEPMLTRYLQEFADCFARRDTRAT